MNIRILLGKQIKKIRKSRKLTQKKLAEYVGLDVSSISNIENGKYYPTADNLDKILNTLHIKPSELLNFEDKENIDILIDEMTKTMRKDENLARLMYKFFNSIKY